MFKKPILLTLLLTSLFFCLSAEESIYAYKGNLNGGDKGQIALCCVFKNEASWLKEWIEYHRLIGVDHFYLYNNLSSDDYLKILSPYIHKGILELYDYPKTQFDIEDQVVIYDHALSMARGENSWLVIIDTDEFVVPMHDDNIKDYLARQDKASGLRVHWQIFGTSQVHHLQPGELLIEKLLYRAPSHHEANVNPWSVKSIVQPLEVLNCRSAHECDYDANAFVYSPPISEIRIHHYFMRTEQFLHEVKIPRITKWSENWFTVQKLLDFVAVANSEYDDTMARFIPRLKKRMQ